MDNNKYNNNNQQKSSSIYEYKKYKQQRNYKQKQLKNYYYTLNNCNKQQIQQSSNVTNHHQSSLINDINNNNTSSSSSSSSKIVTIQYDFAKLPNIVLQNIYSCLSLKDRLNASSTCSTWRQALYSPKLWQNYPLIVYLCCKSDIQSAQYKSQSFSRYTNRIQIKYDQNDYALLQEVANTLDYIRQNRYLTSLSLYQISNFFIDDYTYSNAKLINIDRANRRIVKILKEIITNSQYVEHISFGFSMHTTLYDLLNNLSFKMPNKIKSFHISSIKQASLSSSSSTTCTDSVADAAASTNYYSNYNNNNNNRYNNNNNNYYSYHTNNSNNTNNHINNNTNSNVINDSIQQQLIDKILLQFNNLNILSIDYEHLNNDLLRQLCKKPLKRININVNEMSASMVNSMQQVNRVSEETWSDVKLENPELKVTLNVINVEDMCRKYETIMKKTMPLDKFRMYFCKSLNPDILQYIRDNYCETLRVFTIVDTITEPTLRYHNPFRFDADPLVLLVWKCKYLQELTLIGYEMLEINLTAISQLRNNLKIFHIPIDCVITLRFGQFENNNFIEDEDGNDTIVDYGICSNQIIDKVSKALGYNWHLLDKDELPLCVYDYDMPYEEAFIDTLIDEQYNEQKQ